MSNQSNVVIKDGEWVSCETYIYITAKYRISCPSDRICQVGMGIVKDNVSLGEKLRFSGDTEILIVGGGELRFRVDDGKGPCSVSFERLSSLP